MGQHTTVVQLPTRCAVLLKNRIALFFQIVTQGQEKYLVILDIKFSGFYEGSDLPNENFLGWFLEHVIKTDGIAAVNGHVRKGNAFVRASVPRFFLKKLFEQQYSQIFEIWNNNTPKYSFSG